MIFELLSWISISLISFSWGSFSIPFLFGKKSLDQLNFPFISFIGLLLIGLISWYCSLFSPLYVWLKLLAIIPSVWFFLQRKNRIFLIEKWSGIYHRLSVSDRLLFYSTLLMILLLSSYKITHPDTLNYHADAIKLYTHYGLIPGLANVKTQLGFQSLWFALMNFFDFSALQPGVSFPLNGCLLSWFALFIVSKIAGDDTSFLSPSGKQSQRWACLVLFTITFISWTQIRLTAASASPDFVAALTVFCGFFFLMRADREKDTPCLLLAVFFSLLAISIKMSAAVMIFVPAFAVWYGFKNSNKKFIYLLMGSIVIVCTPLFLRNFITSGYPLYPSPLGAVCSPDWKMSLSDLFQLRKYIKGFARLRIVPGDVRFNADIPVTSWFPEWWSHLNHADQLLLLTAVAGFLSDLLFFRYWKINQTSFSVFAFLVACCGSMVWFIQAPDPRFGTAFILPLLYFQFAPFANRILAGFGHYEAFILQSAKRGLIIFVLLYAGYRFKNFFLFKQISYPLGIEQTVSEKSCDEEIKVMLWNGGKVPAYFPDSCKTFRFRGERVGDGFKPGD